MSTDRDTIKSPDHQPGHARHRDDDDESHDAYPKELQEQFAKRGDKRVAQASGPDPKKAHETSDSESIDAAAATLDAHAKSIDEHVEQINKFTGMAGDVPERQRIVKSELKAAVDEVEAVESYCAGLKLPRSAWEKKGKTLDTFEHALLRLDRARNNAVNGLQIRDLNVAPHTLAVDNFRKATGSRPYQSSFDKKDLAKTKLEALELTSARDNLEAVREAARSAEAGNSDDVVRLVSHLKELAAVMPRIRQNSTADYNGLATRVKEATYALDALEKSKHSPAAQQTYKTAVAVVRTYQKESP